MWSILQDVGAAFGILVSAAGTMWAADPALPYGINAHLPSSALLDHVAAAGIAWIRVDFKAMAIVTTASGASSDGENGRETVRGDQMRSQLGSPHEGYPQGLRHQYHDVLYLCGE